MRSTGPASPSSTKFIVREEESVQGLGRFQDERVMGLGWGCGQDNK